MRHLQDGEGAPTPVSDKGGLTDCHLASIILSPQGLAAFQLVSVESQGRAVVWTVLDTQRDFNTQLGLAHWGQLNHYRCYDVKLWCWWNVELCLILNWDSLIGDR